ncbi:hypothetical protein TanjilG_32270 [Lupinus angustifolius]|uniref:Uncharacterized protein n=1 Tax=Lupinus angustifolius TaxID=3871 RepID=A0A1J7FM53_LUPAN|nr:hypothetical protein TanjilG_32270 [Lupinus angustifolius]
MLSSMCFKLNNKKDDIAVQQEPKGKIAMISFLLIPIHQNVLTPDAGWYIPLRTCVVVLESNYKKCALTYMSKWSERLHITPECITAIHGASSSPLIL